MLDVFLLRFILIVVFCCLMQVAMGAQQLPISPDAAKPGAVDTSRTPRYAPMEREPEFLDVPPVYKRPLGVDEGPRIFIDTFKVTGVVDRPELGITQETIDELVERLRLQVQSLDIINEQGFTKEEMQEIAHFMKDALGSEPPTQTVEEYLALVRKLREDKLRRESISIGELQEIADEVTRFYRESGLIVAYAYVPAQTVDDGVVTIHVLDGILGQILVEDNKNYSTGLLTAPFDGLEGEAVTKQSLESALLTISDYPGLTSFGVLQPGQDVGETELVLKVLKEKPHQHWIHFDNYGTESTGEYRLSYNFEKFNPFKRGDFYSLSVLKTFDPSETLYGAFAYETPVFNYRWSTGAEISRNAFDLGREFEELDISGESKIASWFIKNQLQRNRERNLYWLLDLSAKRADTEVSDRKLSEDELTVLGLEFGFDSIDTRRAGINQFTMRYDQGLCDFLGSLSCRGDSQSSRRSGAGEFASGKFEKISLRGSRFQSLTKNTSLLFRGDFQWSNDLLLPLEQAVMGGPGNVRAYPTAEFLRDKMLFLSLEYNINAPGFADKPAFGHRTWGEIFQTSLFLDYSKGRLNDPLANEDRNVELSGMGIAFQFLIPNRLAARLEISSRLSSKKQSNDDNPQLFFSLDYYF